MSDSFRNEKGQFISGAPWQYKNGHPQSNFIQSKEIEWLKRFFDYDAHERELEFECNYTETDSVLLIFE